jgi:hypothetical protein
MKVHIYMHRPDGVDTQNTEASEKKIARRAIECVTLLVQNAKKYEWSDNDDACVLFFLGRKSHHGAILNSIKARLMAASGSIISVTAI